MIQPLIKAAVDAVWGLVKSPQFRTWLLGSASMKIREPEVQRGIKEGVGIVGTSIELLYNQVKDYAFRVSLRITNREKETRTVLEAAAKLVSNRAENISNSSILQCEYIVNNININIYNITVEETDKMERKVSQLVQLKGKLPNLEGDLGTLLNELALRSAEQEVKSIDDAAYPLLYELAEMLSKATDYPKLQEALRTG